MAIAGVMFAVLMMFMQLGFMNMLFDSAVLHQRQINADIPVALEKIVLRCLEQDPSLRYPSMSVLTHELRKALYV